MKRNSPLFAGLLLLLIFLVACMPSDVGLDTPAPPLATETEVSTIPPPVETTQAPLASPSPTEEETPAVEPTQELTEAPLSVDVAIQVAYIKDGNVWLWDPVSGARQLTSAGQATAVRLSDDWQVAAFTRQVDDFRSELWAVNADGSDERALIGADELDALEVQDRQPTTRGIVPYRFDWMPGTHTVAFNTQQSHEGPSQLLSDDLRLVDADFDFDSLEQITLLPSGEGGDFYFSPDGRLLAVTTPDSIDLMNVAGSDRRRVLEFEPVTTYSEYLYYARPVWSPDSSYLLVAIPPADPLAEPAQPTTLWESPAAGGEARQLSQLEGSTFFGPEAAFSPDLSRVLYTERVGEPAENMRELHIAQVDGTQDQVYLTAPLMEAAGWAGDSDHFLFRFGQDREVRYAEVGGSDRPLIAGAQLVDVRFVDPQHFLYIAASGDNFELGLGNVDGATHLIDTITGLPPDFDFNK